MVTVQNDYNIASSANGKASLCLVGNWAEENAMLAATGTARVESLSQTKLDTHARLMAHHASQDDRNWQSTSHAAHHSGCSALATNAHQKVTYPLSHGVDTKTAQIRQQSVLVAKPPTIHNALPRKHELAEQKRLHAAVAAISASNAAAADVKQQQQLKDAYGHKPATNRQKILKPVAGKADPLAATGSGALAHIHAPAITVYSHKVNNALAATARGVAPGGALAGTSGPEYVEGSTSLQSGWHGRSTHFTKPIDEEYRPHG